MHKIKLALLLLLISIITTTANAQYYKSQQAKARNNPKTKSKGVSTFLGIGLGLDYGGLGLRVEILPIKYLGIFGGLGYNFDGLGYNMGISFKVLPDKRATPVFTGMYGYNAVLLVHSWGTTYYGPTVGGGAEIKLGRYKSSKLLAHLLVPIRNQEFIDEAKRQDINVSPIAVSVGFNWNIH
jgi:hypothetical protein